METVVRDGVIRVKISAIDLVMSRGEHAAIHIVLTKLQEAGIPISGEWRMEPPRGMRWHFLVMDGIVFHPVDMHGNLLYAWRQLNENEKAIFDKKNRSVGAESC